jgi:signal transduction histidine kinase
MQPVLQSRASPNSSEEGSDTETADNRTPSTTEDRLRLLIDTGLQLASQRDQEAIVQAALDAGLRLCGAHFGAFFYNIDESGQTAQLYKVTAADPSLLALSSALPPTDTFARIFLGGAPFDIHRFDDLTQIQQAPQYGDGTPFPGMRPGHAPVRSLLAVPVRNPGGELLGGLLHGHFEAEAFDRGCEQLVAAVASQAAVAIDNARLSATLSCEIAIANEARQRQRETAGRLAQVFEATTDGVALMDRDWKFTYLNRRGIEIVAAGVDIVGKRFLEVFPDAAGSVFEQRYAEVMDQGRSVEFTDYYARLDIWAYIRAFPTADGIAIFFQDVTQQRRAEQKIADSARRLGQALQAAQLGTWSWNRASDLLDLDERAARLLNTEAHTPVTRTALRERIVVSEDLPMTVKSLQRSLESGGLYSAEYRVDSPSGQVTWVSSSGIATFSPGCPEITGMVGTVQDITARKNGEAALRQSEKLAATGRLAATIAHEINNPLEAVTNLIYLSKTDPAVPAEVKSLLDTADHELARVSQIAQQTLGFYRDTGRTSEIDLNDLLERSVDLFARRMQSRKIDCTLDLDPGLRIIGLPGEIRQVVSNLLVNAIDASSGSGSIHIRARGCVRQGVEGVCMLVVDRGTGIPAAARARLFSPFFTTKATVGTGLGLWVTRGIVEKHGGSISFRSRTEPPSGTVFRVFLPRVKQVSDEEQTEKL